MTPRTDAAEIKIQLGLTETETGQVPIAFARQLERELASATNDAAMLAFILDCHEVNADQFYWLRKAEISHVKAAIGDFMGVESTRQAAVAAKGEA